MFITRMKQIMRQVMVLFLVLTMPGVAALAVQIHNLGVSSGLANGYIHSIAQDKDGYVWIATNDGLSRFDGHGFINYNTENSGLSGNELNALAVCKADSSKLWIATQRNGLCYYDTSTGKIEAVDWRLLRSPDISSVVAASDGGLWLAHYHFGVQYYNSATGAQDVYDYTNVPGLKGRVWTVAEGRDGVLYIGHIGGGMSVLDTKTRKLDNYMHVAGDTASLPGNDVYSICVDRSGSVWVGTDRGAAMLNPHTGVFTSFVHNRGDHSGIMPGRIWVIRQMDNDEIWFGTSQGGVSILDPKSYAYTDISRAEFRRLPVGGAPDGLSSPYIYSLFQDSFGNIWLGHYRAGIDVIDHLNPVFERVKYSPEFYGHAGYLPVWNAVYDRKNSCVWLGGENELVRYDRHGMKRVALPVSASGGRTYIHDLSVDREGRVWIATSENGALIYEPSDNKFSSLEGVPVDVRTFFNDYNGHLFIGTENGLYVYGFADGSVAEATDINNLLEDKIIQSMAMDSHGRLWVGTFGKGIMVFDPSHKLIAEFNQKNGFPSNAIHSLRCDSRGLMWAATRNGLIYFPDVHKPFEYKEVAPLKRVGVSHVMSIEEDYNHNIWASTNKGIALINFDMEELSFYNDSKELPLNSFFERGSTSDDSGRIYFASNNGLISLDPSILKTKVDEQDVALTAFTVMSEQKKKETGINIHPENDRIKLPYNLNSFRISFNVLDHAMASRTDFAYNMEGVDDVWTETSGDNVALYRNLPPGKYKFRVRQRHKGMKWGEPKTILEVSIAPPFYLTWWAKVIYILLGAAIVYFSAREYKRRVEYKQRLAAEVKDNENRQKLNEERLRFYTNITHELRTPLTLILGPLEDLVSDPALPKQYSYKLQMIRDSSNTLLGLINGILEFRKTETQNRQLMVKKGVLSKLVRETGLRFKELNRNPDVEFIMDIEGDDSPILFDAEMITIILNNLLSNAVKYTSKGYIKLSYHVVEGADALRHTLISVEDTGYGITKKGIERIFDRYYQVNGAHQASGTGIGLALVKNLADLHQAKISVESEEGSGSVFTLDLLTDNMYPDAIHGADEVAKKTADGTDADRDSDRQLRLLVVEDNADIREYISQTLSEDFDVVTAKNGLEGLHAVQSVHPDMIISDIMMPEMDGIEMCRAIKEDILTSHIPIILLTAKDSMRDKEEGYESGADSYLTKPFSAKLLMNRIQNLLRSRRRIAAGLLSETRGAVTSGEWTKLPDNQPSEDNDTAAAACGDDEEVVGTLNPLDRQFIDKIMSIINDNIAMEDLGVTFIADKMCMSSSTLYRKIMAIVGVSTNEYIRKIRLARAAEMLLEGTQSITDVAYRTGFGSHSSFAKSFKKEYGMTASEYIAKYNRHPE